MKKNKVKIPKWKTILLTLESLVVVFYLFLTVFFVWYKVDKQGLVARLSSNGYVKKYFSNKYGEDFKENVQDTDFDQTKVIENEGLNTNVQTYTNIALFGLDSRGSEFDNQTHSDSIIIVSINNKSGEVRMVSVYRDTMLKIVDEDGDVTYFKANSAFFKDGPECAINMLNTNLDLNIKDYVVVNFSGLTKIIDALGGIDMTITHDEMVHTNNYLVETREITGLDAPDVPNYGKVHLSGLQATAFCRIRYSAFTDEDGTVYNNDMGRTARQRFIIRKIVELAKKAGVTQVLNIADEILHYNTPEEKIITTSLSFDEVMNMIPTLLNFSLAGSQGFPVTYDTPTIDKASMVVAQGLEYNVSKLHEFLFDEKNYRPSQTVQTISDYLIDYTGVTTEKLPEDETVNDE